MLQLTFSFIIPNYKDNSTSMPPKIPTLDNMNMQEIEKEFLKETVIFSLKFKFSQGSL